MLQVIVDSVAGCDDSDGFIKNILHQKSSVLAKSEMSFSYVVAEGPRKKFRM